ncbi:MAG TPA: alcohol dehydrogenase catalytic domain-containing protein [Dehalococcoidia bacterium]|nr:alcohol dehydrogenase catalytic domain-containing protein [Dehalococcoidia bacterium]
MRAAVLTADGRFTVEEVDRPAPTGSQAVLRVKYCGICGSDLHAVRAGNLEPGAILGHEVTGEIVELGPDVAGFEVGDRVTTLSAIPCDACQKCAEGLYRSCEKGWQIFGYSDAPGGYAEEIITHASIMAKVPEGMTDLAAAFNEPSIVGLHAVRASNLKLGDKVVVIGAGPIGLLVLQSVLLANAGPVYVVEPSAGRRQMALDFGATEAFDPFNEDVLEIITNRTTIGADIVFECAGAKGTLQQGIELVRPGGQVMVPGVNMEPDEVSPMTMVGKECEIKGSLGGGDLFDTALEYLAACKIQSEPMVTKIVSLEEVDEVFQSLGTPANDAVKVLVAPND